MKRKIFYVIYLIIAFIVIVICTEIGARIIWTIKWNNLLESSLHGYDYADYKRGIIIPKPNTVVPVNKYKNDLLIHNKTIGLKTFEQSNQDTILPDSAILFMINSLSFKGPEISVPKSDSIFRILAIGNSCTWGPSNDYFAYPRVMEREINKYFTAISCNQKAEVVNAGVPGYNYECVLKRLDEFLAVQPDLITIYLGWNRTIARADPQKSLFLYRNFALYKIYYHFFINRTDPGLPEDYKLITYFDPNDPKLDKYYSYDFSYDLKDLDILLNRINKYDKSIKVAIVTLAGVLDWRIKPDSRALEIAYPTQTTNNLYAYPILTKIYNQELRKFAQKNDLILIDFENYAYNHFRPRSDYFSDSVHPLNIGYLFMGEFISNILINYIICP